MAIDGEGHRTAVVDDDVATQIGFFVELFHKEFVGPSVEFPVDVARGFPIGVESVFGKFD